MKKKLIIVGVCFALVTVFMAVYYPLIVRNSCYHEASEQVTYGSGGDIYPDSSVRSGNADNYGIKYLTCVNKSGLAE